MYLYFAICMFYIRLLIFIIKCENLLLIEENRKIVDITYDENKLHGNILKLVRLIVN